MTLADVYRASVGQRLSALAWRPITCDTPGVVSDLSKPNFEFSGVASLFFDSGQETMLTWFNGAKGDYHLIAAQLSDWGAHSLDLVHASSEDPWGKLIGATLIRVSLFKYGPTHGEVVAAQHIFDLGPTQVELWIGVGRDHMMHENDDLVVYVGSPPANANELTLVESFDLE